jgi:hypothetical protein
LAASGWLILCGKLAVMQAPLFDGFLFNPFAFFDDVSCRAELGIGRRDVVQTLVIALVVVVFDERLDLGFKVARHIALTVVYSP